MNNKLSLCIDIGGTHIVAAVIEEENMSLYKQAKAHNYVDSNADKESILKEWDLAVATVLQQCDIPVHSIVISIPGPFDYENGICLMDGMHKYQSLLHMNVKAWFAAQYHVPADRIYFYNDAEAFLLGELYHNNLFNNKVVGLTLGTGLGSARYESSKTVDLNYGSAAFREGIAEDYISTRGIITYVADKYELNYGHVKAIVDDHEHPSVCTDAFDYLADTLADFIHQHIENLHPDVILIGGSIAKAHTLFLPQLQQQVRIPIKIASMDEFNVFCGMASITRLLNM